MMAPPALELQDATVAGRSALRLGPVTLTIPAGAKVAIVGPNGSGKSTLLHVLAALVPLTSGRLTWEGAALSTEQLERDTTLHRRFRRSLGILFQDSDAQLFCASVREEVGYGLALWDDADAALQRLETLLDSFDLRALADVPPFALSGGERRRVAWAASLACAPDIILLDEPTTHVDRASRDRLLDALDPYLISADHTVVTAVHDLALAESVATHFIALSPDHTVGAMGSVEELLSSPSLQESLGLSPVPRTPLRHRYPVGSNMVPLAG